MSKNGNLMLYHFVKNDDDRDNYVARSWTLEQDVVEYFTGKLVKPRPEVWRVIVTLEFIKKRALFYTSSSALSEQVIFFLSGIQDGVDVTVTSNRDVLFFN